MTKITKDFISTNEIEKNNDILEGLEKLGARKVDTDDFDSILSDDSVNKPRIKSPSEVLRNNLIKRDGYDFSVFPPDEHAMANRLYKSESCMGNYLLARQTMEIIQRDENIDETQLNNRWGFPKSGWYYAFLLDVEQSMYNADDYTMRFLITDNIICMQKVSPRLTDKFFRFLEDKFNLSNGVFKPVNFENVIGTLFCIQINNIRYGQGKTFSVFERFEIINDNEIDLLEKMLETMIKQANT